MNERSSRVLVIRGGAIGDFILTLPALRLIRDSIPGCHLEVLGYPGIADLAMKAGLADAVSSLEHRTMAPLFAKGAPIDEALADYLRSFNLVVSYLYDPDGHFRASLERVGVKTMIECSHRVEPGQGHAAVQLAKPLERLAMFLEDPSPRLFPCTTDRLKPALQHMQPTGRLSATAKDEKPALQQSADAASRWSAGFSLSDIAKDPPGEPTPGTARGEQMRIAIHPGSGSQKKNWPLASWLRLAQEIRAAYPAAMIGFITGEAEAERGMVAPVEAMAATLSCELLHGLPLADLADRLASYDAFLGHDSGISHLAAACGTRCLLLFGPTDPETWAPANPGARVICAESGDLIYLSYETVRAEVMEMLKEVSADSQPCGRVGTC